MLVQTNNTKTENKIQNICINVSSIINKFKEIRIKFQFNVSYRT